MSVLKQADSTVKTGAVLVAGLVAGGLTAYVVDGIPRYAVPAAGPVVLAVIAYRRRRN